MGTWGPGNFENDCAADHLYALCAPLLEAVEQAMADPELIQPDEEDGDLVPANLEIIACLSEYLGRYEHGDLAKMLSPCLLPPPETVARWKQIYLEVWDANIDGLDPDPAYKQQRREVLVKTFDRAERLAHDLAEDEPAEE